MSAQDEVPLYQAAADRLYELGWRPNCDAQHTNLRDALPELQRMLDPQASTGGPAFPAHPDAPRAGIGMSLRDYFAAKAMQGFVSSYPRGELTCQMDDIAEDAYCVADAMLRARSAT